MHVVDGVSLKGAFQLGFYFWVGGDVFGTFEELLATFVVGDGDEGISSVLFLVWFFQMMEIMISRFRVINIGASMGMLFEGQFYCFLNSFPIENLLVIHLLFHLIIIEIAQ